MNTTKRITEKKPVLLCKNVQKDFFFCAFLRGEE